MSRSGAAIVVGLDGSASSMKALGWAVDQAVAERRRLVLVHALGEPSASWSEVRVDPASTATGVARDAWSIVDGARGRVLAEAPDLEVDQVVEHADPLRLLLQASAGAAAVVLGSRGRGPVKSRLLGSVGLAMIRHADCPVVIHRPGHPGQVRNGVLVATDASEQARPVLEIAFELASARRLPLTVLHCQWDVDTMTRQGLHAHAADPQVEQLELSEALAGMGEKHPDVHVTRTVVPGAPEKVVAQAAELMNVLVVGNHQGSRLGRALYGSVTDALVEHATCPVVVVPVAAHAVSEPTTHR